MIHSNKQRGNTSSRYCINSEADASELIQNLEECFLGTTWTVKLSTEKNIQSHTGVLPVAKCFISPVYADRYQYCSEDISSFSASWHNNKCLNWTRLSRFRRMIGETCMLYNKLLQYVEEHRGKYKLMNFRL